MHRVQDSFIELHAKMKEENDELKAFINNEMYLPFK